jgi:predicted  nucleic acid-binding Zn-ribbon protein
VDVPLQCPTCGEVFGDEERFCPRCGVPLVRVETEPAPTSARHERARKIKPQYAEGELVRIARAQHQAEAELIQNMLLEEGIPSMTKRSGGFDVPDFLAAGPRDVLVPRSGAEAARDLLTPPQTPHAEPA